MSILAVILFRREYPPFSIILREERRKPRV